MMKMIYCTGVIVKAYQIWNKFTDQEGMRTDVSHEEGQALPAKPAKLRLMKAIVGATG